MCKKVRLGRTGTKHLKKKRKLALSGSEKREQVQLPSAAEPPACELADAAVLEEVKDILCELVDNVAAKLEVPVEHASCSFVHAATEYNSIRFAVRELPLAIQGTALQGAWVKLCRCSRTLVPLLRTCRADLMGQGFCQLRQLDCECSRAMCCGLLQMYMECERSFLVHFARTRPLRPRTGLEALCPSNAGVPRMWDVHR